MNRLSYHCIYIFEMPGLHNMIFRNIGMAN